MDADRLAALHVPVVQLNTDGGFGGECHLDANMVRSALPDLALDEIDLLVIENVGNLVCPAEFRVGEDAKAMVCSVTEGEDKPLKYPLMFRTCEVVVINKIDLLPHLDFDLDLLLHNIDAVNPEAPGDAGQRQDRRGSRRLPRLAARGGSRDRCPRERAGEDRRHPPARGAGARGGGGGRGGERAAGTQRRPARRAEARRGGAELFNGGTARRAERQWRRAGGVARRAGQSRIGSGLRCCAGSGSPGEVVAR